MVIRAALLVQQCPVCAEIDRKTMGFLFGQCGFYLVFSLAECPVCAEIDRKTMGFLFGQCGFYLDFSLAESLKQMLDIKFCNATQPAPWLAYDLVL
ncbi:hypothetical protein OIU77_029752 [Salix suchowensis]|uniref:Uncharacterized protein n=1 Tax=Salix suchowensis TaxID=1278906 RepID=A0ABQ9B9M3_9ROSI|nr:hypothetical protein OIU77_029752 [Salix suchowensis]